MRYRYILWLAALVLLIQPAQAQTDPNITKWLRNTTGATGFNGQAANVTTVQYSSTSLYIGCTSIPSYTATYVAPASGSGTAATNSWYPQPTSGPVGGSFTYRIPRYPAANTGTAVATPPDHVGLWLNGVTMYNG